MNIFDFRKEVCEAVKKCLGEGYTVTEQNVVKLNHTQQLGICIQREDAAGTIIYVESLYKKFQEGLCDAENTAKNIVAMAESGKLLFADRDIFRVGEWPEVKDCIFARLINTEKNQELLETAPHKEICNLSIIFNLNFASVKGGVGSALITNEIMQFWGKDIESLYAQAMENIIAAGYVCMGLSQMMMELCTEEEVSGIHIAQDDVLGMHVLTNSARSFGAAVILSQKVREELLDSFKCELYVIPSSVHELILLPWDGGIIVEGICDMVREINVTNVEPWEVLADSVYHLKKDGTLEIVV